MQDAFDEEIAQFAHENLRVGEIPQGDRQRAYVIVVAMRDRDGVQLLIFDEVIAGQALHALAFGMNTSVEEEAVSFDLDEPGGGADSSIRIEIRDPQSGSVPISVAVATAIPVAIPISVAVTIPIGIAIAGRPVSWRLAAA